MKIDNSLITQWEPKIQKMLIDIYNSRPNGIVGFDKEDIAQELRIKIIRAAESFDETKGIVFNTYLTTALENTKRTLMGLEFRRYSQGKAFQIGNTIIGYDTVWTNAMIGGLFTFFIGTKVSYGRRNPRGGGIITHLSSGIQTPIGPVVLGAVPTLNVVQKLTVDLNYSNSDSKLMNDSYMALDSGTDPIGWNEVVEYSRYSIRVRKMPETISLDDVVVSDEGEKIPSEILEALLDPTNFEDAVSVTRLDPEIDFEGEKELITHNNLSDQEQLFLILRLQGQTMDEITKRLGDSAYKVRQILQEKFSDLADEYEINY